MRVLLSIKPNHVSKIIQGVKIFEFRRRIFTRKDVSSVLIYSTMPVGRLVAEFDIASIIEDEPEALWETTQSGSGITKAYFDAYFEGRQKAFAIAIGDLRVFEQPLIPEDVFENFTPPQSYKYVTPPSPQLELL